MSGPSKACLKRLQKELKALKDPPSKIKARPALNNLLEWHFVIEGLEGSCYEGGVYHGKLLFHPDYPFKAPSIIMLTPSGRFNTNIRLCLSMSDFHPESWNPLWSIGTILTGLMSFMNEEANSIGSMYTDHETRLKLARISLGSNLKNPIFRQLFPEFIDIAKRREEDVAKRNLVQSKSKENNFEKMQTNQNNGSSFLLYILLAVSVLLISSVCLLPVFNM